MRAIAERLWTLLPNAPVCAMRFVLLIAVSLSFVGNGTESLAEPNWPAFRGPSGQGHTADAKLPLTWSEEQNVRWKAEVPGKGWSSPVIWEDDIWMTTSIETTATETTGTEDEKEGLPKDQKNAKEEEATKAVTLRAVCVERNSGKVKHDIELITVENPGPIHLLNSYASPTPVAEAGRLYCHFGTFGTFCLDTVSGKKIWEKRFPTQHAVGPGSSPVVCGDMLVLVCDGMESQYVMALNKTTGDVEWKTNRPPMTGSDGDFHKAFSTPLVIESDGTTQLLVPGAQWFVSYEPATGDMLWHINHGKGFSNVAAPVFSDGIAYLITGFTKPELWAIPVRSRGELSSADVLWEQKKQIPKKSSPALVGKDVYLMSDNGVLSCVDIDSGEIRWTKRIGGNYSSSPIYTDGKIYFCSHEGKTTVIKPNSQKFEQLAENELDGQLMASPVPSEGALYIRSDTHLYRIEEK